MRLFSFKGRTGRMEYFLYNLLDDFIMLALIIMIIAIMAVFEGGALSVIITIVGILCIIAVLILGIVSDIAVTVRRFHDLGRSGSDFWLLFIPIYNIFLGLTLLFKKGIEFANEYGPNPREKSLDTQKSSEPEALQIKEQVRTFPDS